MAKLKGKAKQQFLARMNRGRVKAGLKKIGSKTKSKIRSATKRSSLKTTRRSVRSVAKTKTKYRRSSRGQSAKNIAKKMGMGTGIGIAIRLATMFFKDAKVRELGVRAASVGAAWGGGPVGELGYQIGDAALSRIIPLAATGSLNGNGGGNQIQIPNPLAGGA